MSINTMSYKQLNNINMVVLYTHFVLSDFNTVTDSALSIQQPGTAKSINTPIHTRNDNAAAMQKNNQKANQAPNNIDETVVIHRKQAVLAT